ncbi:MAG TPA: glycosyltransferase family 4 protein [Usitatibacter sp.]|nr:glycosyltransferase family 4 protein [Usitatibacter sp.]
MSAQPLRIAFVVEHALGHVTHAQALERAVDADGGIAADWIRVAPSADDALERMPCLPFSMKMSLRARRSIAARLREQPLDGLFMHTQNVTPACSGVVGAIPSVISLDATPRNFGEIADGYGERGATGLRDTLKTAVYRHVFARARMLVTMSSWARDSLLADYGVDPAKVAVVPPGIDLEAWRPREAAPARGPLRLLFVGGDFRRKGGATLIEAFRHGLSKRCELDIVTRDENVPHGPGIRLHRGLSCNDPALRELYARADLFVLPSKGDASPFVVIEAMASGLPVVATDVGAIREMVRDGSNGCLVRSGDALALIGCVRELDEHRERLREMGHAARSAAEKSFDARRNYSRLVGIIKQAAGVPA